MPVRDVRIGCMRMLVALALSWNSVMALADGNGRTVERVIHVAISHPQADDRNDGSKHDIRNTRADDCDRIQPYRVNPFYWQYKGAPVLRLGGTDDDHLFQWTGQRHRDQLRFVYEHLAERPAPINHTKIYGADTGPVWTRSDREAAERFCATCSAAPRPAVSTALRPGWSRQRSNGGTEDTWPQSRGRVDSGPSIITAYQKESKR